MALKGGREPSSALFKAEKLQIRRFWPLSHAIIVFLYYCVCVFVRVWKPYRTNVLGYEFEVSTLMHILRFCTFDGIILAMRPRGCEGNFQGKFVLVSPSSERTKRRKSPRGSTGNGRISRLPPRMREMQSDKNSLRFVISSPPERLISRGFRLAPSPQRWVVF